jgi:hypothetical protein
MRLYASAERHTFGGGRPNCNMLRMRVQATYQRCSSAFSICRSKRFAYPGKAQILL